MKQWRLIQRQTPKYTKNSSTYQFLLNVRRPTPPSSASKDLNAMQLATQRSKQTNKQTNNLKGSKLRRLAGSCPSVAFQNAQC